MRFADRTVHLKPEGAYQVLGRASALEAEGHNIIHLELGQPDFETYSNITQAGIQAIQEGHTRYTPPTGVMRLREVVAEDAGRRRGMMIRPSQVVISPGAKPSLFFPTLALVERGDEVIIPDPGFPTYAAMIGVAGGIPVPVPLLEDRNFSFDLETFDRLLSKRTRMVLLNSPGNPTGGVMPIEDLEHIAKRALEYDLWVLSDEIYSRMVYDGRDAPSIGTLDGMAERTVIVDGFSKTYAMTGWRLGYGIMPESLVERVELLFTHSYGCTAHFTQFAGIEAVTGSQDPVDEMVATFARRREVLVEGLNSLQGVRCSKPQGAFYVFPNITATGVQSEALANLILEDAGVALLPGTAFGTYGEGYLRLSYASSTTDIVEAVARMRTVLESLTQ